MKIFFTILISAYTCFVIAQSPSTNVIYVKKGVVNGDGSSWSKAFGELADALKYAKDHESQYTEKDPLQIWVAEGTYTPSHTLSNTTTGLTDRDKTFLLVKNTKVYGGFKGNESSLNQRNWHTNKTILSGDIGTQGDMSDNVYHVVVATEKEGATTLDGFTITGGNANANKSTQILEKFFNQSEGGGMSIYHTATLTVNNCIFRENSGSKDGAALFLYGEAELTNCVFADNKAIERRGSAVYAKNAAAQFINCTFYNTDLNYNYNLYVNGKHLKDKPLVISNCILLKGNIAITSTSERYCKINNNISKDTYYFKANQHNINSKELQIERVFKSINPSDPHYLHLKDGSIAIDKGDKTLYPNLTNDTKDLAYNSRVLGSNIDIGAYESTATPCNVAIPTVAVASATCAAFGTTASISNYSSTLTYTLSPTTATLSGAVISNMVIGTKYVLIASDGTCTNTSDEFQANTTTPKLTAPMIQVARGTCEGIGSTATITNYNNAYTYTINPPTATITGALISNLQDGTMYVVTAHQGVCSATSRSFKANMQLPSPATPIVAVASATGGIDGNTALITNYERGVGYTLSPTTTSATLVGNYISGMVRGTQYTIIAKKGTCEVSSAPFEVNIATGTIQRVHYVKKNATGNGTGESWENAINELADALRFAKAHENLWTATEPMQIWVAADTYTPTDKLGTRDTHNSFTQSRDITFLLPKNVKIYGGFAGTETNLSERNWHTNRTILSGDIGTKNSKNDNVFHVVTAIDDIGVSELNGFTITDGNAVQDPMYGGSTEVVIGSYHITRNKGAALLFHNASPRVENCIITQNGMYDGGAIFNNATATPSTPTYVNVLVTDNDTFQNASAIYNNNSHAKIINSTFYNNKASSQYKELYNTGSTQIEIYNSVILGESYNITNAIVKNSLVKGITAGTNGNLDAAITNATDVFITLTPTSADYLHPKGILLNAGDKNHYPAINANSKDLAHNPRVSGSQIDIGAYEYQPACTLTAPIIGITPATCSTTAIASITNYSPTLTYNISPSGSIDNNGVISATAGTTSYSITVSDGVCTLTSVVFTIAPVKPAPATPIIAVASATGGVDGTTALITNYDARLKYKLFPATTSATLVENYISGMVKGVSYSVVVEQRGNICTATSTTFQVNVATGAVHRIRYVKKTATGNGTGESWENAMTELADALRFAEAHKELWTDKAPLQIWVAADTYIPLYKASQEDQLHGPTSDRDKAFMMVKNVKIYGGFKGDETKEEQRDWHNHPTILSGEIDTPAIDDNLYHIMIAMGEMGIAEVNGFTFTRGAAVVEIQDMVGYIDPDIRIDSKDISRRKGSALYTYDASLRVENCSFIDNDASTTAAIYNFGTEPKQSQPVFINVLVAHNNTYEEKAGGICNDNAKPIFINNTIYKNTAKEGKSFIEMANENNASPYIYNTVIFEQSVNIEKATVRNSFIKGVVGGTEGNLSTNDVPDTDIFVSVTTNTTDFLHPKGILVNAGDRAFFPLLSYRTKDLAHNPRFSGKNIDIGVYEYIENHIDTPTDEEIEKSCSLTVYNGISANGDGRNDILYIENIECYPNNTLTIFDETGKIYFKQNGYNNTDKAFRGYANEQSSELLNKGTYFYVLTYTDLQGSKRYKTGYLYINL